MRTCRWLSLPRWWLVLCVGGATALVGACTADTTPPSPVRTQALTADVVWSSEGDGVAVTESTDRKHVAILTTAGSRLRLTQVDLNNATPTWDVDVPPASEPLLQSTAGGYVVAFARQKSFVVQRFVQDSGTREADCIVPGAPLVQDFDHAWIQGKQWSLRTCAQTGARLSSQPAMVTARTAIVKRGDTFDAQRLPGSPFQLSGQPLSLTEHEFSYVSAGKFCVHAFDAAASACAGLSGAFQGLRHAHSPSDRGYYAVLTDDGALHVWESAGGGLRELRVWTHVSDLSALDESSIIFSTGNRPQWRRIADDTPVAEFPQQTLPLYTNGSSAVLSRGTVMLAKARP